MFSRAVLLSALSAFAVLAQAPEFEVATLKLSPPPESDRININLGQAVHGKVTLGNATLADCLKFAYNLSADAQLAGPGWIRTEPRFDIVAQAPPDTPRDRLLLMTQKLLADRLNLRVHREDRELTYVALVPAKGGPKLKEVPADTPVNSPSIPGRLASARMNMATLAKLISRFERQTVIDETGLDGFYEIHLEYTPTPRTARPEEEPPSGPSIYTSIQQQLGLKLERRKGPVSVLVVDSSDRVPAAN